MTKQKVQDKIENPRQIQDKIKNPRQTMLSRSFEYSLSKY